MAEFNLQRPRVRGYFFDLKRNCTRGKMPDDKQLNGSDPDSMKSATKYYSQFDGDITGAR